MKEETETKSEEVSAPAPEEEVAAAETPAEPVTEASAAETPTAPVAEAPAAEEKEAPASPAKVCGKKPSIAALVISIFAFSMSTSTASMGLISSMVGEAEIKGFFGYIAIAMAAITLIMAAVSALLEVFGFLGVAKNKKANVKTKSVLVMSIIAAAFTLIAIIVCIIALV